MPDMAQPHRRLLTAEDLYELPLHDVRAELVRGNLICEPPAGFEHGVGGMRVGYYLHAYIELHPIGVVCNSDTGFVLFRGPDTVRAPDASFVTAERAARQVRPEAYFEGAPDLAVEVVSPGDSAHEVAEKVADYLAAGTRLVWVVHQRRKTVTVHDPGAKPRVLTAADTLDGGDLLPGFLVPVGALLAR
jgi:Uma2 family endonuclease